KPVGVCLRWFESNRSHCEEEPAPAGFSTSETWGGCPQGHPHKRRRRRDGHEAEPLQYRPSHTAVPTMRPTTIVSAIAATPQITTRRVPRYVGAPPKRATQKPVSARATTVALTVITFLSEWGQKITATSGSSAPTVNAAAEAP